MGLGAANLAAGFFQGFPISSSSSRTPVAEAAGAKTQLTRAFGVLAVALLLLADPEPLFDLPASAFGRRLRSPRRSVSIEITDLVKILPIQGCVFRAIQSALRGRCRFWCHPGHRVGGCHLCHPALPDGRRPHSARVGPRRGRPWRPGR